MPNFSVNLSEDYRLRLAAMAADSGSMAEGAFIRLLIDQAWKKYQFENGQAAPPKPATPSKATPLTTAEKHAKVQAALAGLQARSGGQAEPDWGA